MSKKKKGNNYLFGYIILAGVLIYIFFGSSNIPSEITDEADKIPDAATKALAAVKKNKQQYDEIMSKDSYSKYKKYATAEKWEEYFSTAVSSIGMVLKNTYEGKIKTIIDDDKKEQIDELKKTIKEVKDSFKKNIEDSRTPLIRIAYIEDVIANASKKMEQAKTNITEMEEGTKNKETLLETMKTDFPQKTEFTDQFKKTALDEIEKCKALLSKAESQYQLHQADSDETDYALMGSSLDEIADKKEALMKSLSELPKKNEQLRHSYSRVLTDMKEIHYVVFERTSWDDYSDYNTESNYTYDPIKVSGEQQELFEERSYAALITILRGKVRSSLPESAWKDVNLDLQKNWPRRHNSAEYWYDDSSTEYYHKYTIIEDDKTKVTDWEKVEAEKYFSNLNNLNMTIESKPLGYFKEEAIKTASPVGMEYVGNEKYGQWKKDASGNRFWEFMGPYLFFRTMFYGVGYRPYYYNDWYGWRSGYRNRKPYYGNGYYGSWGSANSKNEKVRNSHYYKSGNLGKYKKSGGVRSRGSLGGVRGAAGSTRGRGPGTRGK